MASKGRSAKSTSSNKSHSPTPSTVSGSTGGRKSAKSRQGKAQGEDKETLAFKIISSDQTKGLSEIDDVDILQSKIAETLKVTDSVAVELKNASCLDYFVSGFWWGKEQGWNVEQLSALFTVLHNLLENIREKHLNVVDNLREFKKMLVGIGVEPQPDMVPPHTTGGLDCLDTTQAKALADFLHRSLFQHHRLYEYIFSHTQAEEVIGTDLEVETPKSADLPWPPPLLEGLPEDMFNTYIAPPPPSPPPKPSEEEESKEEESDEGKAEKTEDLQKEADILSQLTPEQVKVILDEVFTEMLGGVKLEIAAKLREKENAYISRINKIHRVADH